MILNLNMPKSTDAVVHKVLRSVLNVAESKLLVITQGNLTYNAKWIMGMNNATWRKPSNGGLCDVITKAEQLFGPTAPTMLQWSAVLVYKVSSVVDRELFVVDLRKFLYDNTKNIQGLCSGNIGVVAKEDTNRIKCINPKSKIILIRDAVWINLITAQVLSKLTIIKWFCVCLIHTREQYAQSDQLI